MRSSQRPGPWSCNLPDAGSVTHCRSSRAAFSVYYAACCAIDWDYLLRQGDISCSVDVAREASHRGYDCGVARCNYGKGAAWRVEVLRNLMHTGERYSVGFLLHPHGLGPEAYIKGPGRMQSPLSISRPFPTSLVLRQTTNMMFNVAALTAVLGFVAGAVADGKSIFLATFPHVEVMLTEQQLSHSSV